MDTNPQALFQEGSSSLLQLEASDLIVVRDQEPLDRPLFSQIEEEYTIDKLVETIVPKIKCLRYRSRGIFSKSLQFLFALLLLKICRD